MKKILVPEGTLIVIRHDDRPGVISAISVSEPVTDALLQQLYGIAAVHQVTRINL